MSLPLFDPLPPYQGTSAASTHASYTGAVIASRRAVSQANRMLVRYLHFGPMTDSDMADVIGIPEARVSARRSQLIARDCVAFKDHVKAKSGATVCRWDLTVKGAAVARRFAE